MPEIYFTALSDTAFNGEKRYVASRPAAFSPLLESSTKLFSFKTYDKNLVLKIVSVVF